jgi:hypothetical protein
MPNATTDRTHVTIRWVEEVWSRVCVLADEWGVSRNDMANILMREALDSRDVTRREFEELRSEHARVSSAREVETLGHHP